MKILALAAAFLAAPAGAPDAAQFAAALAAACPDARAETRNVSCSRPDEASIQYSCRYELRSADGRWTAAQAILQLAEGEWVWIDGPTGCSDSNELELN